MNIKETLSALLEEYDFVDIQNALLNQTKNQNPLAFMQCELRESSLYDILNNARRNHVGWKIEKEPDDYQNPVQVISHGDFYYKITGTYSSYGETTWDKWEVVTPKTKTVTYFE